jgi:hypothetical protein
MIDIKKLKDKREPKVDPEIKRGGWESTAEIITSNKTLKAPAIRRELQLSLEAGLLETREFPTGQGGRSATYWREKPPALPTKR